MLLPEIAPSQPYPLDTLLRELDQLVIDLNNSVTSGTATELLANYQYWANEAASKLSHVFSHDDVARLVLTPRHWALMSMTGAENQRALNATLLAERLDRSKALTAVEDQLRLIEQGWRGVAAEVVAPDTNVYLHNDHYFDEIDWKALREASEVRLLVPVAVVRELDRQKRVAKNVTVSDSNTEPLRVRARETARRLRNLFAPPQQPWAASAEMPVVELPSGVEVELVLDPLRHHRIEHTDSEIIDRLLTVQRLVGRQVAIATSDGGMMFSARAEGLGVIEC